MQQRTMTSEEAARRSSAFFWRSQRRAAYRQQLAAAPGYKHAAGEIVTVKSGDGKTRPAKVTGVFHSGRVGVEYSDGERPSRAKVWPADVIGYEADAVPVPEERLKKYSDDIKTASRLLGPDPGLTLRDVEAHNLDAHSNIADNLRAMRNYHRIREKVRQLRTAHLAKDDGTSFQDPRYHASGREHSSARWARVLRRPLSYSDEVQRQLETGELSSGDLPDVAALARRISVADRRPGHLGGRKRTRRRSRRKKRKNRSHRRPRQKIRRRKTRRKMKRRNKVKKISKHRDK